MIREFIENADFSDIPIGPQAELIEDIESLNSFIPRHFDFSLSVTDKFRWKPGTYDNIERLRSYFLGTDKRYKSVNDIFDKPERNRAGYYLSRFRRSLRQVDKILNDKRITGAIWSEDESIVEELKQEAIEKAIGLFFEYSTYQTMMDNDIEYFSVAEHGFAEPVIDEALNSSFKFENETSKIILDSSDKSIIIIQPFKDVIMNVYNGDGSYPMFRFNNGNILASYKIDLKRLIYWAIGTHPRRMYRGYITSKFWYKPSLEGNKHPFVQFPERTSNNLKVDDWTINYERPSGTCYGNFNYINGGQNDISFVKWCEEVHAWLTTFRTGMTHPLNSINTCYYGNPEKYDENIHPDYLDIIGINRGDCSDRMANYHQNAQDRQNICNNFCTKSVMTECNGYNTDIRIIRAKKLESWSKYKTNIDEMFIIEAESSFPGNFNWDHEGTDDDYPTTFRNVCDIDPEDSLQQDMLRWVREVNNS
jgi:hypothetical protein